MNHNNEIRIGILCSGMTMPAWHARCIRHLLAQPDIQVMVLGVPIHGVPSHEGSTHGSLRSRILALLCPDAEAQEDLSELLNTLPVVAIRGESPDANELRNLEGHGANVLLSFLPGRIPPPGTPSPVIWQFDLHGSGLAGDGFPEHTGWMLEDDTVCLRSWGSDGTAVSTTYRTSLHNGRLDVQGMLQASAWLPIQMHRARLGQWKAPVEETADPTRRKEGLFDLFRQWLRLELRPNREVPGRTARIGEWNLGIYPHPISTLLSDTHNTNVRWLSSPSPGSQRTEPFGYRTPDGQLSVLYRKSGELNSNDSIARVRPRNDGILKRSRNMLSTVHALGYPYTVERPDGVYVVVSYPHQDRIELFRVAENNESLDHVGTLLERALMNPTCVEHAGGWWLFGTDMEEPDTVLRAYHAPQLHGPYQPHALNPVRVAGSGCRSAGTFFIHDGYLWRPSVDNTDPRGPEVIFNRINVLDTERFHEEPMHTFAGFPGTNYPNGIRTVCALGNITLIDGLRPTQVGREVDIEERRTVRKAKAYTE